ncbi:phage tail protein [Pararhizobium sp. LjRoot235]|uniref:phage tail protein n=1 Tax=Pararhizobium sp. LjRoot235 TaxID=3342291 RepID=UPI003ECE524E
MKLICIALTMSWFILSGAELAYGEPVTAAIFGAAFASSFAGQLATLGLGLAFNFGVGLIQKAKAKRKAKEQTRGISFELQVGDNQPMSFTLGKYASGGRRKYTGIHGQDGRYFVDVIELGNLPCPGLPEFWVNDEKVTLDWENPNPNGFGYPVPEFSSDGTDRLWIIYHDGTQTTADAYLLDKFGSEPDRPWSSDMIGRGCPYIIVTARFNPEIFSSVPTVLTEMPVRPVYDLRKDSTNGGSGSHRWDNPATWEPSENPIINTYNIVRGIYYGDEWIYGGQNLAAFRLPASNWIAAANECDVDIALSAGGTERQFRCGYEVFCDVEPLTVIEELLQACNGRMAEVGGIFKVLVGAPGAAVYSFTDEDVLVTEGQSFNPFPPFSDTHNGIEATYPEPAEKWATKDAPARYSSSYMEADLGQELVVGVEFEACPFKTQVQRLMKTMLKEERRFRTHEFYLPPSARRLEPNDVVSWSSDRNGYINKKFFVVRVIGRRTFNQLVSLKEIDPSDYDWEASEELPTVVGPVKPITPDPQPMTGWTAAGYTVLDSSGNPRRPGIKVTAAADLDDVKNVRIQVRLKSSGAVVFDSDASPYGSPYEWIISGQWTLPNALYQARGRLIPYTSRETLWSSWLDVTTPNVLLSGDDIYLPGVIEDLREYLDGSTAFIREGLRQTMLEQQRLARLDIDKDIVAYTSRQSIRTEATATTQTTIGIAKAYAVEQIDVATGPTSALARRTTTLEATLPTLATNASLAVTATALDALVVRVTNAEGNITAIALDITSLEATIPNLATASALSSLQAQVNLIDGVVDAQAQAITSITAGQVGGDIATANFRMQVTAGPSGYASRIAMEARTGGAGAWRAAGWSLDVPASASSPTRFNVTADQFSITNGTNVENPFVFQSGVATLNVANIGTVNSGRLLALNGKMDINLNNGTIEIYS